MSTASSHQVSHSDPAYQAFVARMQRRFEENLAKHKYLFTTDVDAWSIYLDGFAHPDVRQYNNCHCCKEFMRKYGNLVCIQEDGTLVPALWFDEDAEGTPMQWAVLHVIEALVKAKVTGVFYTTEKHWGKAQSGGWDHLAISVPVGWVQRKSLIDTAYQQMAKKKEDFKNLKVARSEFARELVGLVVDVLKTDTLYRNDKLLGPAEFFQSLYGLRDSQVWLKVAGAPDGFCHPKSSMFGTLLDDFKAGMSFDVVKKRFEAKMHPLQYQRPQAAPTSAAIKRAEEIAETCQLVVDALGVGPVSEVRSVIEAYSNSRGLQGLSDGSAVGISVGDNSTLTVHVAGERITAVFEIDRWS